MDALGSILFYVFAAVALVGALAIATLPTRRSASLGVLVLGVGLAGLYATLSAGFVALVALVCYLAVAGLLAAPLAAISQPGGGLEPPARWSHQVGALGAVLLFAILAYAAFRLDFAHGSYPGGAFGSAAIGRLLIRRDALASEALSAMLLMALVGGGVAWRLRRR